MHEVDGDTFEGDWQFYVKKPIPVRAIRMDRAFKVTTLEGIVYGKAGDYLIIGIAGERYPCAKEIFEKSYDALEKRPCPIVCNQCGAPWEEGHKCGVE